MQATGIERHSKGEEKAVCSLPNSASVGLKLDHCDAILSTEPQLDWFEVHPENYMCAGGLPHHYLTKIRESYELSLHGVGLSIGGTTLPAKDHIERLKTLINRYQPQSFSEHLAWSSHEMGYFNDLLPLPLTEETLDLVSQHIDHIQTSLNHQMLLENPSTYVEFEGTTIPEVEFLTELANRTGCGLLLDVNNVYVSCTNHGRKPADYINQFPMAHVGEIHLGGHAPEQDDEGNPLLIDAHDREVIEAVWALYEATIAKAGPKPTLIEWDNDYPAFDELIKEAERAELILQKQRAAA